jgi:hypothetical protein
MAVSHAKASEKLTFEADIINAIHEQVTKKEPTQYEKIRAEFSDFKKTFMDTENITNGYFTFKKKKFTYIKPCGGSKIENTENWLILDMLLDSKKWSNDDIDAVFAEYGTLRLLSKLKDIAYDSCYETIDNFLESSNNRIKKIPKLMILRYIVQTDVIKI